jgi:FkbM family methyltransferase
LQIDLFLVRLKKFCSILASPYLLYILLRHGVFAGIEHKAAIPSNLRFIVDIGANKGQFALACKIFAPQALIISFEPLPGPSLIFNSIFSKKNKNIKLYESAIGLESRFSVIHLSNREDSSSLLPIGLNQAIKYPGTHEIGTLEVKEAPLENFLNLDDILFPALLKLDVQGYELKALQGCEPLLTGFDYIYCECSFIELYSGQSLADEIIRWLQKHQFTLVGVFNLSYDNNDFPVQGDFLFKKSKD